MAGQGGGRAATELRQKIPSDVAEIHARAVAMLKSDEKLCQGLAEIGLTADS